MKKRIALFLCLVLLICACLPGCGSDKDQQKRTWDIRILPPVAIFFLRYIGPHLATKPHKANRGDGMASGVAEIPTPSGFGPRRHWLQKLRFLA